MTSTLTDKKVLMVGRGSGIAYSIEVLVLPVSDVDQARDFYTEKAGFTLDVDYQPTDDFREWVLQERGFRDQPADAGA
jgi:catechol 2,3-dioxygenase-like lactoylglutathione lyase family enzyme